MYIELNDKLIEKIKKQTITNWEFKGNMIPADAIGELLEDLFIELDEREELLEDLKQDIGENYRPVSLGDQYE